MKTIFEGLNSKERMYLANELLFKVNETKEQMEKAIKVAQNNIEEYELQKWFIEVSWIKDHKDEQKYVNYRNTMLENIKKSIESQEKFIADQQQELEKPTMFLEKWYSYIKVEKRVDEKTQEEVNVALYDEQKIGDILDFAMIIGYIDNELLLKKHLKEEKKEQDQVDTKKKGA